MAYRLRMLIRTIRLNCDFFDTEEPGTDEWTVLSGTFEWDLGHGKVVSVTSYYDRETDE